MKRLTGKVGRHGSPHVISCLAGIHERFSIRVLSLSLLVRIPLSKVFYCFLEVGCHECKLTFAKVGGKGCELTSLDGDTYVDFLGEYSAGLFGHSNERISAAVADAMNKGWNFGGLNTYERELAQKV